MYAAGVCSLPPADRFRSSSGRFQLDFDPAGLALVESLIGRNHLGQRFDLGQYLRRSKAPVLTNVTARSCPRIECGSRALALD
jgi:hypothetical protein